MVIVNHRVAEIVVLVAILQHGGLELRALRQAEALGKAARGDVAHNDLNRHDGHAAHHAVALVELLDQMGLDAVRLQHFEQMVADEVVHHALAHDRALLEAVERGRVIFIMDHREGGIVGRKDLLRLAFIHHFELLSHG